eukprot:TRINITY_DN3897_c1_g1_i1.p1 TRINITY_DN3897_c1_g1~~TRINITY_DN3897_c1_g1_i1.p1  ORF type:complete len:636 (+),score=111.85 TRINITY_DN3897_c1_g1_i1:159-2066(+)
MPESLQLGVYPWLAATPVAMALSMKYFNPKWMEKNPLVALQGSSGLLGCVQWSLLAFVGGSIVHSLIDATSKWLQALRVLDLRPKGGVQLKQDKGGAPAHEVLAPRLKALGHAGMIYQHRSVSVVMDPWFYTAFLHSWFPFPNNRWMKSDVVNYKFDYLFVSHLHEDHFDRKTLKHINKNVTVICADYGSKTLEAEFRKLGFRNVKPLKHHETLDLGDNVRATMILDISAKEDSGLLLEADLPSGTRKFLHLNDCNTRTTEFPKDIDILSCQFAGAQWYPHCYHYVGEEADKRLAQVMRTLHLAFSNKVKATNPKAFVPLPGPACHLDTTPDNDNLNNVFRHNDCGSGKTMYLEWETFAERMEFSKAFPDVKILRMLPGDLVNTDTDGISSLMRYPGEDRPESCTWTEETVERLKWYSELRKSEWIEFYQPTKPVTLEEVKKYIERLRSTNSALFKSTGLVKKFVLKTPSVHFYCKIALIRSHCEVGFYQNKPADFQEEYEFEVDDKILRLIVEGDQIADWEDAMASLRIKMCRKPDVYDMNFMALMRYGDKPAITKAVVDNHGTAKGEMEMIERPELPGVKIQRYCPHQGEDLKDAPIANGMIICPRHGWEFCAVSGKCISGGNAGLKIEKLQW